MLNGRLYRAAFLPFVFALAIAAFSLTGRPSPLHTTLAPDAFEGQRAFSELTSLAAQFPDRRPGSRGDQALGAYVARALRGLGGTAGGGFTVRTRHFTAQTIDGERALTTVIATRPGSTGARPIVILAHRDAPSAGARAELSATAALLELARVFAARETQRTIVLVSTSGGTGGDAGAADFAAYDHGPSMPRSCWAISPALVSASRSWCPSPTATARRRCSCSGPSTTRSRTRAGPIRARRARSGSWRTWRSR